MTRPVDAANIAAKRALINPGMARYCVLRRKSQGAEHMPCRTQVAAANDMLTVWGEFWVAHMGEAASAAAAPVAPAAGCRGRTARRSAPGSSLSRTARCHPARSASHISNLFDQLARRCMPIGRLAGGSCARRQRCRVPHMWQDPKIVDQGSVMTSKIISTHDQANHFGLHASRKTASYELHARRPEPCDRGGGAPRPCRWRWR